MNSLNVFEDLIGELKDENLLEDTVIDLKRNTGGETAKKLTGESAPAGNFAFLDPTVDDEQKVSFETYSETPDIIKPVDEREFFQKRAMEEVSSLQMVEHVLAGVEREHMKVPAAPYDDLNVKKALHKFMQVSDDVEAEAHAEAEFDLMQETQSWHAALSARDKNVSVANIRRFCENSRPPLSSQALMALARFYRNSPFNEDVRGKFDFVITRLFSKEVGEERRRLLFGRIEMIGHIKTLYSNWSSITYHSPQEDKIDIDLAVQRFDDLARHFDSLKKFDDLLNASVFHSIRAYKEECGEMFYVAEVTAAAVDCNIRLGNKYVDLIFKERHESCGAQLEEKYGYDFDLEASTAAGKTLLLAELLRDGPEGRQADASQVPDFEQEANDVARRPTVVSQPARKEEKRSIIFGVNRWLVLVTVVVPILSGGVYFWADKFAGRDSSVTVATTLDLEGTDLKAHLREIRLSRNTAYGITQPSWDALGQEEKKEFLKKTFAFIQTKGMTKVNFLNYKGRSVAFASKDRIEIVGAN